MAEPFVTPEGRLLWTKGLWKASSYKNDPTNPSKFRCSIVLNINDPAIPAIIAEYNATVAAGLEIPPQQPGAITQLGRSQTPCLDYGAVIHPGDAFYQDKIVLNLSRSDEDGAPGVMLDAATPVVDKGQIYDGVVARAHCRFYSYKGGSGGMNCELYAVMKTGDADRLGQAAPDSSAAFAGVPGVGPGGGAPLPQGTPAPANFGIPGQQQQPQQISTPYPPQQPIPQPQFAVPQQPVGVPAAPVGVPDVVPFTQPVGAQFVQPQPVQQVVVPPQNQPVGTGQQFDQFGQPISDHDVAF